MKDRFVANGPDGQKLEIHVSQRLHDVSESGAAQDQWRPPPWTTMAGELCLETADGRRVVRLRKDVYDLYQPDGSVVRLTSDDPDAP